MKIGIVCYPSLGGSGIVATRLGMELGKLSHSVHFISYEMPMWLKKDTPCVHFHQVDINRYDLFQYPDYALTLAVKMAEVAEKEKLDLFHVHYAIPHATSAYLAKKLIGKNAPALITTLHGTDITVVGQDPAYFEIVKFSIENSDYLTAVSNHLSQETLKVFQITKPIDVIYNFFIPDQKLKNQKPLKSSFVKGNEKLILHASNFREVKRIHDVISIYQKIQEQVPSKLLLLGTGPLIEEAYTRVQNEKMEESVIFLGLSSDIDPYLASADLFLLPSEQESFGLVALEAMAYGVPVVATNAGGIPEVVKDGETGFLSAIGDVDKMANDAVRLLHDDALRQTFGLKGMCLATKEFGVERILPKYLALYERALLKLKR